MAHSIGKTIRRLRKEREMTQEELAFRLNISAQAVSRWENETCMPDISQIVPIAGVFGVSTDILFGTFGVTEDEEVDMILREALGLIGSPATTGGLLAAYQVMQKGLSRYPGNLRLLSEYMEVGLSLAYPENYLYDKETAPAIYEEMVRAARLIVTYGKNVNHIMRAHTIMVLLHAANGNMEAARKHAAQFPDSAGMTSHFMYGVIAHFEKDELSEIMHNRWNFLYQLGAMANTIMRFAALQFEAKNNEEAAYLYQKVLELEALVSDGESYPLTIHMGEYGDAYAALALLALREGDRELALSRLEEMTDYDIGRMQEESRAEPFRSPLFSGLKTRCSVSAGRLKKDLITKLSDKRFQIFHGDARFECLMERAKRL